MLDVIALLACIAGSISGLYALWYYSRGEQ
jgi:hypothetical protein